MNAHFIAILITTVLFTGATVVLGVSSSYPQPKATAIPAHGSARMAEYPVEQIPDEQPEGRRSGVVRISR